MAEEMILLDTGATENFINQTTVDKLCLGTKRLPYSQAVYNIDGTLDQWNYHQGMQPTCHSRKQERMNKILCHESRSQLDALWLSMV